MAGQHDTSWRRILVVYESEAFFRGVQVFLSDAPGIQIVGAERDARNAVEVTWCLEADVVVLEHLGVNEARDLLVSLLELPGVRRIVTLSLESTSARVYESHPLRVEGAATLIAAVQGNR